MYLLKYHENSNSACQSNVTAYAALEKCAMQMQGEFWRLKVSLGITDEELLNSDALSDTGGRISEKGAFLCDGINTYQWEIICEPQYIPANGFYQVSGVYHDLESGETIHCTPVLCHDKKSAQERMYTMLKEVLDQYKLEENGACDEEGNAIPGGCIWEGEASIYAHAPYALDCLIEVASFTVTTLKLSGTFVSVWDGDVLVSSPCIVDFHTGQVTVTGANNCANENSLQILEREYVQIGEQTYPAVEKEEYQAMMENKELTENGINAEGNQTFWYE